MMRSALVFSFVATLMPVAGTAGAQGRPASAPTTAARFERAWYQWDAGAYDSALVSLQAVLRASDAAAYHDRVAELTGEIFSTVEIAKDARAPVWSSDGRHLAYTLADTANRRFVVKRMDASGEVVLEAPGTSPVFAPDGRSIAWLTTAAGRSTLNWKMLDGSALTRHVLDDQAAVTSLTLVGSPLRAVFIVGVRGDSVARVVTRALPEGALVTVDVPALQPVDLVRSPNGARVVVTLGARGPFARPTGFGTGGGVGTGGGAGTGAGPGRNTGFAELGATGFGEPTTGSSVTFSRDGSTIAWQEISGLTTRYRVKRGAGEATTAATIERPAQSLVLSPDGSRIAFGQMLREDWELFTAPSDGASAPARVTREIQHDLFPQFLANDRLFAVMGEARHRRSYSYDLTTGTRTRLFHNNSVRTVAPEYEWAVSPDGSRVAIVAERDGDTVTPHRHLFVMDLSTKVSHATLVARVDSNLTAERALRERAAQMFAPIEARVRAATEQVSVARIYENERSLFGFDSKNITQAGNVPATEWLLHRYQSYGLTAHLQRFTTSIAGRDYSVANVVAVVPGTVNPELVYVVGAHFDSRAEGPGADDNTSGTAMILETARVIAQNPLPTTVMFVAFTGEESGLRGAREFARRMKDSIHVIGALNNDMMGWSNDHRMDNTIRYSNPGLRDVQHAAAIRFSRLITYDAFYFKSTDAHALYDAWGDIIAGIGSHPILGNPHYHQSHDVLETINHQQLAETSKATIATIMLMASTPSRLTGLVARAKVATWDAAPERGVTRYLVRYGPPENPMQYSMTVNAPRATLDRALEGWKVAVKAIGTNGVEGWDWAWADVR